MSDRKNTLSRANIPDWAFVLYPTVFVVLFAVALGLTAASIVIFLDQLLGVLCG